MGEQGQEVIFRLDSCRFSMHWPILFLLKPSRHLLSTYVEVWSSTFLIENVLRLKSAPLGELLPQAYKYGTYFNKNNFTYLSGESLRCALVKTFPPPFGTCSHRLVGLQI